jgi:hypothetical protein
MRTGKIVCVIAAVILGCRLKNLDRSTASRLISGDPQFTATVHVPIQKDGLIRGGHSAGELQGLWTQAGVLTEVVKQYFQGEENSFCASASRDHRSDWNYNLGLSS